MTGTPARYVVDHLEGDRVVLVADAGGRVEAARGELPFPVREGMVLMVPVPRGVPDWRRAERDAAEERRREEEGRARLGRLKGRDPGGDITA